MGWEESLEYALNCTLSILSLKCRGEDTNSYLRYEIAKVLKIRIRIFGS